MSALHLTVHQRPGTWDRAIFESVLAHNEYRIGTFHPSDTVIDIGAHIGGFSCLAALRGAGRILAFEPYLPNFVLARKNCQPFPAITLHPLAVWRSDGDLLTALPYQTSANLPNTGGGGIGETGAFNVSAIALDAVLRSHARVRCLKLDCEGSEWPILLTSRELGRVETLVGEYHLLEPDSVPPSRRVPDYGAYTPELLKCFLAAQGFIPTLLPCTPHLGHFWATRP